MEQLNRLATSRVTNPILGNDIQKLNQGSFFSGLLSSFMAIGFLAGGLIFVVIFIVGSISWISAGGDKGQTESARNRLTQAVVGLIILFSIFAIIKLVEYVFSVSILNINLDKLKVNSV